MLTVNHLCVSYGPVAAVKDISLTVEQGRIVSLIGANGAGKSSIIRAISRLISSQGEILLGDTPIQGLPPEKLCSLGLATVPEGRHVFSQLTVEENLLLGAHASQKGRENLSQGLADIYTRFPRLRERKNQLAGTMSGGEQQMLALGRALISKPNTLLLDEPSMGLAPMLVSELFDTLLSLKKEGLAILLVEQNASKSLAISDYVYLLENGSCIMSGKPQIFDHNKAIKTAYLGA